MNYLLLLALVLGLLLTISPPAPAQQPPNSPTPPVWRGCRASTLPSPTQPLLIIDGLPLLNTPIEQLNPAQIVRVEVLKDTDATAIYGSQAAQGVVIITSTLPWVVEGQLLRGPARQKAALRDRTVDFTQLLSVAESARYGAAASTQVMLVKLQEQPARQPGSKSLRQPRPSDHPALRQL